MLYPLSLDCVLFAFQCSTTCGRGVRKRIVTCVNSALRPVPVKYCDATKRPIDSHRCRMAHCPRWKTAKWSMVRSIPHKHPLLVSHFQRSSYPPHPFHFLGNSFSRYSSVLPIGICLQASQKNAFFVVQVLHVIAVVL